ncbi:hypothetical protein [Caballeronia concitans]|uniref:hypothetical protein n=1 Tax=Caballeronia concitans TaxID=1777133 RepID=UPI001FCC0B3A|nr:hypothetical protein [Caballeronia concitans]
MMTDSVFLRMAGQADIGPSGVFDQSRNAMMSEQFPPPVRKGGIASVVLEEVIEGRRKALLLQAELANDCTFAPQSRRERLTPAGPGTDFGYIAFLFICDPPILAASIKKPRRYSRRGSCQANTAYLQ